MDVSKARKFKWVSLIGKAALYAALLWFTYLMGEITFEYWPFRTDVGFMLIKQHYLGIKHWEVAFWVHVFSSMFALVAGFTQFSRMLLRRAPKLHRGMGKLYVINVLLITGPAGLVMSVYANGGWTSKLAFLVLSLLWWFTTFEGWRTAHRKRWLAHRDWMIRSYALTLSAITLRCWKYLIATNFEMPPMDMYRLVAWLGFVPNLLVAEWIVRSLRKSQSLRPS